MPLNSDLDVWNATDEQLAAATNEELAAALLKMERLEPRQKLMREIQRRNAQVALAKPFNPRVDISADAQYLWKRIFIWFWVVPLVLGVLAYIIAHM